MKCITTRKKIRETRGAIGKMAFFPTMSLSFHPSALKTPSLRNLCFWNEQDLGKLLLKRN